MKRERAKVQVTVYPHLLAELPIFPPRRRLQDFFPNWLFIRLRRWMSTDPTPYEMWVASGKMLRMLYAGYMLVEQQRAQEHIAQLEAQLERTHIPPEELN